MSRDSFYIPILIILLLCAGLVFLLWLALRYRKISPSEFDGMEGHEFEVFCANLLKNRGFQDVEVTRASKDYGVDILAQKDGISYAVQCKCYNGPVGIKAVQEAYAGRDYYDCMVGVVLTNQYFTTPAVEVASKLKILLWDRGYLESMLDEGEVV